MTIRYAALFPLGFCGGLVLLSCSDGVLSPLSTEPDAAVSCPISGSRFRLGSTDAFASPEEFPGWTRFRHDYRMDPTEVTQAEYLRLMGRNPSTFRGDSLPVTDVSWYDAVLAANARSRLDGLDTVYEYVAISSDALGNASNLEGLTIHLDRSGWRLPTEAEWEAAARAGTSTAWAWGGLADSAQADKHAWYQKNSRARPHPVATKSPNSWGLYDMAGNVMEWVNDWKGPFPKDTVDDFAGQESPGDVAEMPLKGGAYNYGLSQLRPSSRAATYAAYRSSRAEYVGFRLCRGGFTARYVSTTGSVVYTPPVTLVRTDVPRLTRSWEARLVFVNRVNGKGILTWIDYGESNPVARSLPDKDPVFHPVISPDGRWVAWSTVLEGSTQPGRIKARRLAKNDTTVLDLGEGAIPRWWVSGTDTFLVAGDARDNLSSGWSDTKTVAWRWSNGALSNSATWSPAGSYHDGRSGPYLYTGYRRLRQYDMRGGTSRILFTAPSNGKGAGDTSQVCNVSAAPDSSGRSMFLDFGYTGKSNVVGRPYGIHEIAFVTDSTGRVEKTIPSPSGEAQWEHMEWSNAPRWAVSGAIDGSGAYRNIYLVDLDNAVSTKIVSGEQLWQPGLWVGRSQGEADGVSSDSVGQYFLPKSGVDVDVIGGNLLRFWLKKDSVEAALVGSSQFDRYWPSYFTKHSVALLSWSASVHSDYDRLIRRYLLPHAPNLKVIAITLMPGWFFPHEGGWPSSRWDGGFSATLGSRYDADHGYWTAGTPSGFEESIRQRMKSQGVDASPPPVFTGCETGWGDSSSPEVHPATSEDTTQASYREAMALMERLLADVTARGIHVILLHSPENPAYRNGTQAGYWGPTWPAFRTVMARARSWENANPLIHVYDANKDGLHDFAFDEFGNENHLAGKGIAKLSARLDSMFTVYMGH